MDKQTDERVQLRRLAALMGWAEFRVGSGEPVPPLDSVSWADEGDPWGIVVWRDADDEGAYWNSFTNESDAIELAEHLSREGSPRGLELARSYERAWGLGPMGWAALFFDRGIDAEPVHITDRLDAEGTWAPTFARAVSLAALAAFGEV